MLAKDFRIFKALLKTLLRRSGYLVRTRSKSEYASASLHRVSLKDRSANFLVLNPSDSIQHAHVMGHFYEQEELEIMEAHFAGGTFLDVGANVGNHAVYFASLPTTSHVIAFEPHPEAFALLSFNVFNNGFGRKTTLHDLALSDTSRNWEIRTPLNNLGGSTLEGRMRGAELPTRSFSCSSVVGDAAISQPINFVKIDVEGHELSCLEGLTQTLIKYRPPVFVEVSADTEASVMDFMNRHGFKELLRHQRYRVAVNILFQHDSASEMPIAK